MFSSEESDLVRDLLEQFNAGSGGGHTCLVDEYDEQVVGVAYYQPKGPADRVWDLTMIAVAPQLQGAGRGGALLEQVEDDLRDRGQRLLLVDTSGTAQYDRTRDFYVKCGYTAVARIPDYWTDGDDLVVFVKHL
jgi:ribosomal protein S18 acetylase RimI-like enzyme